MESRAGGFHRLLGAALGVALLVAGVGVAEARGLILDAFGVDAGGEPRVRVYFSTLFRIADFLAFDAGFRGGVRVAVGDMDGDGFDDVVAATGPGGAPLVRVFRGTCGTPCTGDNLGVDTTAPIAEFLAFDAAFRGGLWVTVGNFDTSNDAGTGTGGPCIRKEIAVGADAGGGPEVRIFRNGTTGGNCPVSSPVVIDPAPIASFFPYPPGLRGGVRVSSADFDGDGLDDLVTGAGPGAASHVQIFRTLPGSGAFGGLDTANPVLSHLAFPGFEGGIFVSAGFADDDFAPDLLVGADAGGGPRVLVIRNTAPGGGGGFAFDLANPIADFLAFDAGFRGGVRVGAPAAGTSGVVYAAPGPGAPGVVGAFFTALPGPPDAMFSAIPFSLFSFQGVLPSQ
jgi:hypothetical protein